MEYSTGGVIMTLWRKKKRKRSGGEEEYLGDVDE